MSQWVYSFGAGSAEGRADMQGLLGGKGANLAEMSRLGLPVPPGFTITTEVCSHYYRDERRYPEQLTEQVAAALARTETELDARLGDPERPLLVSVRSGAPVSMPGMMDTILDLGLDAATTAGLAAATGDQAFAQACRERLEASFRTIV